MIYYFSGAGHCKTIAQWAANTLGDSVCEIQCSGAVRKNEETAIVVFPVYCQNIPNPVKQFLFTLAARKLILIAAYGSVHFGNVLWEAARLAHGSVIAAAYIPTGHSFLHEDRVVNLNALLPLFGKIKNPNEVILPKLHKHILASFFPELRSKLGVKIKKTDACNACGMCSRICPVGTMKNGTPGKRCMRCLRCLTQCPQHALEIRQHFLLKRYLGKKYGEQLILYL